MHWALRTFYLRHYHLCPWGSYSLGWKLWWTAIMFSAPNLPCLENLSPHPLSFQPCDPSGDCHDLTWDVWSPLMDLEVCLSGLDWTKTEKWELANLVAGAVRYKTWHHQPCVLSHVVYSGWRQNQQAERNTAESWREQEFWGHLNVQILFSLRSSHISPRPEFRSNKINL